MQIFILFVLCFLIWFATHTSSPHIQHVVIPVVGETLHAYYINLDHRGDRKEQIELEMRRIGFAATRVPGIPHACGALGCSLAHSRALKSHVPEVHYCVFEDDAHFRVSRWQFNKYLSMLKHLYIEWDVIMFLANVHEFSETACSGMLQIHSARTTAGFMVHRDYLPQFRKNVEAGIAELQQTLSEPCIDTKWLELQATGKWFTFYPSVGFQRDGYSDIVKRVTNYPDKRDLKPKISKFPIARFSNIVFGKPARFDIRGEGVLEMPNLGEWLQWLLVFVGYHPWTTHVIFGDAKFSGVYQYAECAQSVMFEIGLLEKMLHQDAQIYECTENIIPTMRDCLRGWQIFPVHFT